MVERLALRGEFPRMFLLKNAARSASRDLVSGYLEEITNHGITEQRWDAMSRSERNAVNDRLRAAVVDKEAEVVALLCADLA